MGGVIGEKVGMGRDGLELDPLAGVPIYKPSYGPEWVSKNCQISTFKIAMVQFRVRVRVRVRVRIRFSFTFKNTQKVRF